MSGKLRVAFVDDELHILNALRRSMAEMADDWDMTFCESAAQVLALMARQPFDVLVTDMRMPQMDGGQLLQTVKETYPGTVRAVLSGYADAESVLRTVDVSHFYLAKPCSAQDLHAAIDRQIGLCRLLADPSLRASLTALANLPSPPAVVLKLQKELQLPTASFKSVASIVGEDMAMVAEILRLTNSAYFSINGRATTPMQAIRTLGLEVVHALALRIGLFRQFKGNPAVAPMISAMSQYGLVTGRIAEAIVESEIGDAAKGKAAYCAALLSTIGCLVLLDGQGDKYVGLLGGLDSATALYRAEEAAFGANHAVIGAYLLGLWGFANPIVEAVAYSNAPSACAGTDNILLTAVHAALALGPQLPILPAGNGCVLSLDTDYLAAAGFEDRIERWCELALQCARG